MINLILIISKNTNNYFSIIKNKKLLGINFMINKLNKKNCITMLI